ncbi:MAG: hypothetical protein JWM47_1653 [Acidimicrobiales bacterium]|nr:hypothetical protein [Acidimicrobiales bacterium]
MLHDAQASGMNWSQIGSAYGVSRQAAHQRFGDETVLDEQSFADLLRYLDEPPEVVPALARAVKRSKRRDPAG